MFSLCSSFYRYCEYCIAFWKVAALLSLLVHTQQELTLSYYRLSVMPLAVFIGHSVKPLNF